MSTVAANKLSNVSKTKQIDVDALIDKVLSSALAITDLSDVTKGGYNVGWLRNALTNRIQNVADMLNARHLHPYEYAHLVVDKPNAADPLTWDWTPALQALFNAAFSTVGIPSEFSASVNHSGVVIDMGGKCYRMKGTLQIPNGGGVTITNGLLLADSSFTASNLVRQGQADSQGALRNEAVIFDRMIFDCRNKTGGVFVSNSIRTTFDKCTFIRYLTDGIRTFGNNVEVRIAYCNFGTKVYNNPVYDSVEVVGVQTGIRLGSTDNRVIGCIFHRGRAIIAQAQAQHISACQFYGSDPWGSAIDIRTSDVTVVDCAFGKFGIAVYSPFNVIITNNMFVMENTSATDWGIALIPTAASEYMSGVQIFGNTFRKVGGAEVAKSVHYDTTQGTITRVRSSRVRDNSCYYVRDTGVTQAYKQNFVSSAATSTFDFSTTIEYGIPVRASVEFMQSSGGASVVNAGIDGNVSQVTMTSIPVKLSATASGTLICFLSVEEGPLVT